MHKKPLDIVRKDRVQNLHPHTMISCGKDEMALMQHLKSLGTKRLNIKAFSRDYYGDSSKRTKIYYYLNKLIEKELVYKPNISNHNLTEFGKNYLEVSNRGVKPDRRRCNEKSVNLSTHYIKYRLPISNKIDFNEERLIEIGPNKIHKVKWNNDFIHYAYFDDATIIINPNVVLIRIHDIMTKDTELAQFETLNKALIYSKKIRKIGLKTESIELESAHFARVDSLLADFLKKIDNRYFLVLEDGSKFWIDCSGGKIEDETDDETKRSRIDRFMSKIMNEDINLDDLKSMKEIIGMLTVFEISKIRESLKPKLKLDLPKPDYFG